MGFREFVEYLLMSSVHLLSVCLPVSGHLSVQFFFRNGSLVSPDVFINVGFYES